MMALGAVAACYALVVLATISYRAWVLTSSGNRAMAYSRLSVRWAWDSDLVEFHDVQLTAADRYWIAKPHKLVPIFGIVTYQCATRLVPGRFRCPQEPNCSNYAIGLIRRHPIFTALRRASRRVRACGAHSGGPHFADDD
jgi:putative component of membrane protein insertase Oxa1/YidC/SpoIIIJ protein YidD